MRFLSRAPRSLPLAASVYIFAFFWFFASILRSIKCILSFSFVENTTPQSLSLSPKPGSPFKVQRRRKHKLNCQSGERVDWTGGHHETPTLPPPVRHATAELVWKCSYAFPPLFLLALCFLLGQTERNGTVLATNNCCMRKKSLWQKRKAHGKKNTEKKLQ